MKFEAEGREFEKSLRSLEQFIQTVKGQTNFAKIMHFEFFFLDLLSICTGILEIFDILQFEISSLKYPV